MTYVDKGISNPGKYTYTVVAYNEDGDATTGDVYKRQGYIAREEAIAKKLSRLEHVKIRGKFKYSDIHSLSTEARQKLEKIDPETVGQASRIPGISPSDVNILLLLLGR